MTDSNHFYAQLKPFSNFEMLSKDEIFQGVPDDWFVVITDIEGSTKLVAAGRYQEVNTVGAATIAVVQSVYRQDQLAFVFGGDGATFLVAPGKIEEVKAALSRYKSFCLRQYEIGLRVGTVQVGEITGAGQRLEAAKFNGAGGKSTVFIRGGGLAWAEHSIKYRDKKYLLQPTPEALDVSLNGVSCRWKPIPSGRGKILTILVQPRVFDTTRVFENLLAQFRDVFGGSLETSNLVNSQRLRYGNFWSGLLKEWRAEDSKFSKFFFMRIYEFLLCQWAFNLKWPVPFAAAKYVESLAQHSDYRKYDDMLRLVLDCTTKEVLKIQACLQTAFEQGDVFYGTFESSHALMTCLVESLSEGGHIHLIDGSDGGYTLAAKNLNQQRKSVLIDPPAISAS